LHWHRHASCWQQPAADARWRTSSLTVTVRTERERAQRPCSNLRNSSQDLRLCRLSTARSKSEQREASGFSDERRLPRHRGDRRSTPLLAHPKQG
jgi:hypothetical protein